MNFYWIIWFLRDMMRDRIMRDRIMRKISRSKLKPRQDRMVESEFFAYCLPKFLWHFPNHARILPIRLVVFRHETSSLLLQEAKLIYKTIRSPFLFFASVSQHKRFWNKSSDCNWRRTFNLWIVLVNFGQIHAHGFCNLRCSFK